MKKNDPFSAKQKYNIIKPFLDKKKKLVVIAEESGVPYSTLKRWVSTFKKKGVEGLEKNTRKDKSTYRSVNKETIEYIKNLYFANPDIKILDAHKETLRYLTDETSTNGRAISYDTVYRIIKSLDPFIKTYPTHDLFISQSSNEIFEFRSEKLDIKIYDWTTDEKRKPYLNIIYDNYSGAIASFAISFDSANIDDILFLLRSGILTEEENSCMVHGKPVEFVINNARIQDKSKLEKIKDIFNMEINFYSGINNHKLDSFYDNLNNIILKNVEVNEPSKLNYFDFGKAIGEYINNVHNYFRQELWENHLERLEIIPKIDILNPLLMTVKSKRIIQPTGVKYQNLVYKNDILKDYIGEEVEIKYNPINIQSIKIYYEDNLLCDAFCQQLLKTKITLYEIKMLQHYIFMENSNRVLTPSELTRELVNILENNV